MLLSFANRLKCNQPIDNFWYRQVATYISNKFLNKLSGFSFSVLTVSYWGRSLRDMQRDKMDHLLVSFVLLLQLFYGTHYPLVSYSSLPQFQNFFIPFPPPHPLLQFQLTNTVIVCTCKFFFITLLLQSLLLCFLLEIILLNTTSGPINKTNNSSRPMKIVK